MMVASPRIQKRLFGNLVTLLVLVAPTSSAFVPRSLDVKRAFVGVSAPSPPGPSEQVSARSFLTSLYESTNDEETKDGKELVESLWRESLLHSQRAKKDVELAAVVSSETFFIL